MAKRLAKSLAQRNTSQPTATWKARKAHPRPLSFTLALPLALLLVGCNAHTQASAQNAPQTFSQGQRGTPQLSMASQGQSMGQSKAQVAKNVRMKAAYQQPNFKQRMANNGNNNSASQTQGNAASGNQQMAQQIASIKNMTEKKINKMGERVRRVERAMIRLDRRMQIIERNELTQMSGLPNAQANNVANNLANNQSSNQLGNQLANSQNRGNQNVGQFKPTSFNIPASGSANGSANGAANNAANNFGNAFTNAGNAGAQNNQPSPFARGAAILSRTPFANRNQDVDTQKLQSKHVSISPLQPANGSTSSRNNNRGRQLASLADKKPERDAETNVAIWTVNYDRRKIWPDRGELAASSDVVSALREGKPSSVFARGARPSSKEFRERVRALSRYLGRVSDLESVPIASMPADHLNTDTIELVVAN